MNFFYKIYDQVIFDVYCYLYFRKSVTTLIALYFVSLFINTALCDHDFESENDNSENNVHNVYGENKKYSFSQLNNESEVNSKESAFEHLSSQQKQILLGAIIFGFCVLSLWIIMNSENRDLKKAISELENKTAQISKALNERPTSSQVNPNPISSEAARSEEEWQRPPGWKFGFV